MHANLTNKSFSVHHLVLSIMRLVWWGWGQGPGHCLQARPPANVSYRGLKEVTWRRVRAWRRTLTSSRARPHNAVTEDDLVKLTGKQGDRGRPPPPWYPLWHFVNTLPNSSRMLTEKMVALMIVLLWNWTHIFAGATFTSQKGDTFLTFTFLWCFQ